MLIFLPTGRLDRVRARFNCNTFRLCACRLDRVHHGVRRGVNYRQIVRQEIACIGEEPVRSDSYVLRLASHGHGGYNIVSGRVNY